MTETVAPPPALIRGYRAFRAERLPDERARFDALAEEGQSPQVMLIGCCDSRVPPEVIFDARPGEMFVVRNVANLVPPYRPDGELHGTSAALEYAVQALRVRHIVVLGHGRCGGLGAFAAATRTPLSPGDFIGAWVSQLEVAAADIAPDARADPERFARLLEPASLKRSLAALRSYPCIATLEARGKLTLHAAHFDIRTGALSWFDEEMGVLMPCDGERVEALRADAA